MADFDRDIIADDNEHVYIRRDSDGVGIGVNIEDGVKIYIERSRWRKASGLRPASMREAAAMLGLPYEDFKAAVIATYHTKEGE